jgi:hypothetical protein
MQAQSSPLEIIITPPDQQFGMPGNTVELYVVVKNQGNQDAVVDLYFSFDDQFANLMGRSVFPQESLAIAPQQTSDEVKFQLHIPDNALPGTYDYTLIVDAPQHYPQNTQHYFQNTPIHRPLQLKVQIKEQTIIRINDPTFSIKPSSNTGKPLILNPSQPVEVIVENRSKRVDSFHLTCKDLDKDWFTITYPTTGAEGTGQSEVTALKLNPNDNKKGQICLTFHPPGDTLAGPYTPNIRLHSENSPDLVLLDLVYIQIPPSYHLDVQLRTILAQVSRSPAKYELSLINQGNVVRELNFTLESRDEEALYTYQFEPSEVRLLPNKKSTVNLTIKPRPWWRRHWSGGGLVINFQAQIQDKNNLPLTNNVPQLSFVWKPRPWWQFLLLILVCLGLFSGTIFIIWRLLNPDPVTLEEFHTSRPKYTEGDEVKLSWKIKNYQNLQSLLLTIEGTQKKYYLSKDTFKDTQGNEIRCQPEKEYLSCDNVPTGVGVNEKGKRRFELQVSYRKGALFVFQDAKTAPQIKQVEISEKPIPTVVKVETDKTEYTKGDKINLSWTISNPLLLKEIQITGKAEDGTSTSVIKLGRYPFNQDNQGNIIFDSKLQNKCKPKNQQLECNNIPISLLKAGKFTFEITAFSNNGSDKKLPKKTESAIEILPKPFRIVSFTLNGSELPNQELKEGTTAILSWQVEGEDIQVKLLDPIIGYVPSVGSQKLPVNQAFPSQIKLQVNDKLGKRQPQEKAFAIAVIKKVEPTIPPPSILPAPQTTPVSPSPR